MSIFIVKSPCFFHHLPEAEKCPGHRSDISSTSKVLPSCCRVRRRSSSNPQSSRFNLHQFTMKNIGFDHEKKGFDHENVGMPLRIYHQK